MNPPTRHERARRTHQLRFHGLSWEQIAAVWESDHPEINPRIAFRWAHNLSHQKVADRWNALDGTREPTMVKNRISQFERWQQATGQSRKPSVGNLAMLARIYQTSGRRLLTAAEYVLYPASEQTEIDRIDHRFLDTNLHQSECVTAGRREVADVVGILPGSSAPHPDGPRGNLGAADDVEFAGVWVQLDRRSFNGMAARLVASTVLSETHVPTRVDDAHVRQLRARLHQLRSRGRDIGGRAVLHEVAQQFALGRAMLNESDYTEKIGRQLLTVTTDLGVCAGWQAYDSGHQRFARYLYREAELLSGNTGNDELVVHVYANMAQQSTYLARITRQRGYAREALRFAQRASVAARHEPSPKLHALIALRQATAHAQLGDELAFRAAITQARRELDRGSHPADPQWGGFITQSEIMGYEAAGYSRFGSPARAVKLYRAVIDDTGRFPRDHAYYRAAFVRALLAEGDRTQAIPEGLALLGDLGPRMTSIRVLNELRPVRAAAEKVANAEFCLRFDAAVQALAE